MSEAESIRTMCERIDALCTKLETMNLTMTGFIAAEQACRKQCSDHQLTLYGNGKPGLVTEVYSLRKMWAVGYAAASGIVGMIVGFVFQKIV